MADKKPFEDYNKRMIAIRIRRTDKERLKKYAHGFDTIGTAFNHVLDLLEYYEEVHGSEDPSEGWDDDERLRPEPESREVEDALRADEEARRNA